MSAPTADGGAAAVVCSEEFVKRHNLQVCTYVHTHNGFFERAMKYWFFEGANFPDFTSWISSYLQKNLQIFCLIKMVLFKVLKFWMVQSVK